MKVNEISEYEKVELGQPVFDSDRVKLYTGNSLELIKKLPSNLIQSVITSPTYWGKRQFTNDKNEIGTEKLEEYVKRNVELYLVIF